MKPITLAAHLTRIAPLGGRARKRILSPERRREIASMGGKARAVKASERNRKEGR